jgi:hypothetical protein
MMPVRRGAIASTLVILCFFGIAQADEEAGLSLRSDGVITELPKEYQPAHLSLDRSWLGNVRGAVLSLRGGEYVFPECVVRLFQKNPRIVLTGSWFHDESLLPYYISMNLQRAGAGEIPDGFRLLFNLRTAELLRLDEVVTRRPRQDTPIGTTIRHEPAFEKVCPGKKMTDGWQRRNSKPSSAELLLDHPFDLRLAAGGFASRPVRLKVLVGG